MSNLESLKTLLESNQILSFKNLNEETIDEMLDSRDSEDFELIGKSLFLDFNDEWLNSLFLCYLQGIFPHSKLSPKPNGLELILEIFFIQKLAA